MSKQVPEHYRHLRTFAFGDSPGLADELLELVVKGVKTATCSTEDEPNTSMPGERWVVLDGENHAASSKPPRSPISASMTSTPPLLTMRARAIAASPIGATPIALISAGSDGSAKT
jgi:hypothetical protein